MKLEAALSGLNHKVAKTGKPYINFVLTDRSGVINGRRFDFDGADIVNGGIYTIIGRLESYQGKPQIVADSIQPRTSGPECDGDFIRMTKYNIPEMWSVIESTIADMKSNYVARVASDLMISQGYGDSFREGPAATNMHHAFVGGLLEHTSQMCQTAEKLFDLPFYSEALNKDLCMFGILFHDMGKIFEYDPKAGFKKTIQGFLVPHIPMVAAMIFETCNKFGVPDEIRDHLMHVVLAHHGKVEYGSPVAMATPEAAFVHYVDNLHGTVFGCIQRMEAAQGVETVWHSKDQPSVICARFNDVLKRCEKTVPDTTIPF